MSGFSVVFFYFQKDQDSECSFNPLNYSFGGTEVVSERLKKLSSSFFCSAIPFLNEKAVLNSLRSV